MKRDYLGSFTNNVFLQWVDSPFHVEHNGEHCKSKLDHKLSYNSF